MTHTPEPWAQFYQFIEAGNTQMVECFKKEGEGEAANSAYANAERIVACVNACAGINPEAVPMMFESMKEIERYLEEIYLLMRSAGLCGESWRVDDQVQLFQRALAQAKKGQ